MTRLLFATNNQHKIAEIQAAIGGLVEITGLRNAGIHVDIPEPHDTLEENAAEKSNFIYALTGMSCFSEDTGLEVEALGGEPGVRSARYAGEHAGGAENIRKLLSELKGQAHRKARFRTVVSLIWKGTEHRFEGTCDGEILEGPTGNEGFGYDPVFRPAGSDKSFAQMNTSEKNRFSHRRKAADLLVSFLQKHG